jgi:hypothetical protein
MGNRVQSAPLVATAPRWAVSTVALTLALAAAAEGCLLFSHSARAFSSLLEPLALAAAAGSLFLIAMLRAEESRLSRELRTARAGTPVLRGLVAGRRQQLPFLARLCSTKLGLAAVLLADGDRESALDAVATGSALMRAGRLEKLRAILDADLERSAGTPEGLARCAERLRAEAPTGNREADLYRIHVLVKAILALGDADAGFEVATELAEGALTDDETRVYTTWLRVWFELDSEPEEPWPLLSDGDLRMATLAARAHGAESLVSKLDRRLSAIARLEPRE